MTAMRVELQLDDGSFTSRMLHAGQSVRQLQDQVGQGIVSIRSMERESAGFLRTLGGVTLAVGAASAAIGLMKGVTTGLVGDIVRVNAEFERMNQVLRGMSTAADPIKDAANQVKYLRDFAMQAPFSLKGLTDVFVRMKATGIDPMTGAMKGLVDAVAASGGTEQQLGRAALAISQMSGKGVIQMEELRQQLGEAIPRATELMARSMGVTYADLVQKISTGMVQAKPALAALNLEFDRVFGGAAQAQMNTFNGLINQTKTQFQNLALAAGENGFMDALKTQLRDLNSFLSGNAAKGLADSLGSGLASIVTGLRSTLEWVARFRFELMSLGESIFNVFGSALVVAGGAKIVSMLYGMGVAAVQTAASMWTLTTAIAAQTAAQGAAARASGASAAGAVGFRAALMGTALTIGRFVPQLAMIGIIGAGVLEYFDLFSSASKKADESMKRFGATSQEELAKFAQGTAEVTAQIARLEANYTYYERLTPRMMRQNSSGLAERRKEIEDLKKLRDEREKLLGERTEEFNRNTNERAAQSQFRVISDDEQKIRRQYDIARNEAAKERERDEKEAQRLNKSVDNVREAAQRRERASQVSFYDDVAKLYEKAMTDADKRIAESRDDNEKDVALRLKGTAAERLNDIRKQQELARAQALGVQLSPKITDESKLIEKGGTQLERLRASLVELKAELAGASSESAKLAYELEKIKFKEGLDNPAIQKLIEQIKTAQAEYEALDKLMNGQKKLSEDMESELKRLRDRRFEIENEGASPGDKLRNRVKRGDYEGFTLDADGNITRTTEALKTLEKLVTAPEAKKGVDAISTAFAEQKKAVQESASAAASLGQTFQQVFAGTAKSSLEIFNQALMRTAGLVGDIKSAAGGLSIGQGGSVIGPNAGNVGAFSFGTAAASKNPQAEKQAFDFFLSKGFSAGAAAGLVGNLIQESGLNTSARNRGDGRDGSDSIGISQWNSDRAQNLARFAATMGKPITDFQTQLEFMFQEMQGRESRAAGNLAGAQDARSGAIAGVGFFRPKGFRWDDPSNADGLGNRIANAQRIYNQFAPGAGPTVGNALALNNQPNTNTVDIVRAQTTATRDLTKAEEGLRKTQAQLDEESRKTNDAELGKATREAARAAEEATDKYDGLGKQVAAAREKIKGGAFGSSDADKDPNSPRFKEYLAQMERLDAAEKDVADKRKRRVEADAALKKTAEAAREADRKNLDTNKRLGNLTGRDPSDDTNESLRKALDERLRDIENFHGKESQQYRDAAAENTRIMDAENNARSSKRAAELAQENQTTARSLMTSTQATQAKLQTEITALQQELAQTQASGEARIALEQQIAEKIRLLRQQASASGPMAQAAQQWGDIGKNMETAMVGWIDGGIDAIAEFVATGEMNFKKLLQSIVKDVTKMGLRYLMSQVMGGKGGAGGAAGGKGGKGAAGAARTGGKAATGGKGAFHTGGIVGGTPPMIRNVGLGVFAGAPKFHTGGIIGGGLMPGEVPIIAKQGEGVFTPEQMASMGGTMNAMSQSVVVNVNGGSSGDPKKDQAMGDMIARRVRNELRGMVGAEIKQQLRPGGIIKESAG